MGTIRFWTWNEFAWLTGPCTCERADTYEVSETGQDLGWVVVIGFVVASKITWSAGHLALAVPLAGAAVVSGVALLLAHHRLLARAGRVRETSLHAHPAGRQIKDSTAQQVALASPSAEQ